MEKELLALGLNTTEVKIYLALLDHGRLTAQKISQLIDYPRTSLYPHLESLHERGLITKEQTKKTTTFLLNQPISLLRQIEEERTKLAEREAIAKDLVQQIAPRMKKRVYDAPRLGHFEGKREIERMLYVTQPLWRETYARRRDFTMWGYQDHAFVEHYQKWHKHAWETRRDEEKICLFSNKQGYEQQKRDNIPQREIRRLPLKFELESSVWIHGDYVIISNVRRTPHFALVLADQTLSENLRQVFQLLWRIVES